MFSAPCVTIHGIDHARGALAPGLPVVLLSAPGAALYAGCGWWGALMETARLELSHAGSDLLDCADAPGYAMAALRIGLKGLVLSPDCPGFLAVGAAAAALDAIVLPQRPASLDLAERGSERRLAAWLKRDINRGLR
jgi:hypothetical protein